MTTLPDHLTVTRSDRGFSSLPLIPSEYGGDVSVYESSAASGPHVWLKVECPENLNRPGGPTVEAVAHLSAENAWRVGDQLHHSVREHYQGDATPDWVRPAEPLDSFARVALEMIAKGGCENYTRGTCEDSDERWPDAEYTAERYCDPCIARCGLRGGF